MDSILHILKNIGSNDLQIINEITNPFESGLIKDSSIGLKASLKKIGDSDIENQSMQEIIESFLSESNLQFIKTLEVFLNKIKNDFQVNLKPVSIDENLGKRLIDELIAFTKDDTGVSRDMAEIFITNKLISEFFTEVHTESKKAQWVKQEKNKSNTILKEKQIDLKKVKKELMELKASLSFAGTIKKRIAKVFGLNGEKKNYNTYFNEIFKPNVKIKKTATKFSQKQINSYIDYINPNKQIDIYPTKATAIQFTLPAIESAVGIKTCTGAGACKAFCYASAGTYEFPMSVFKSEFSLIFSLSKEFVPETIKFLKSKIKKNTFYFLRIHDSGDFYSRLYLRKWINISKEFPNILFYGYTKQTNLLARKLPSNFKFSQSFGGRNDATVLKFLNIKGKLIAHSKGKLDEKALASLMDEKQKIIEKYKLNEKVFDRIIKRLTVSKVFPSEIAFNTYQKNNPEIQWILVTDDDVPALDVGLSSEAPVGIALIAHGAKKKGLKDKN